MSTTIKTETCQISMSLNRDAVSRQIKAVETLLSPEQLETAEETKSADTLKVKYDFRIDYFGDIVEKLEAVRQICKDSKVVVEVNCDLLEKNRCLVYETMKALDKLIQTIKKK